MRVNSVQTRLSRHFAILLAATLLATVLVLNPLRAPTVGACGWYTLEATGPLGSAQVYDSNAGVWTWVNFQIETYNDGCGNRFYRLWEWVSSGTAANLHLDLRVWVCGTFINVYVKDLFGSAGFEDSPAFYYYPWCGRQADDYGSGISSGWFNPYGSSVYVTA
jgi:hypothetical protein